MGLIKTIVLPVAAGVSVLVLIMDATGNLETAWYTRWLCTAGVVIGSLSLFKDYMHGTSYHGKERIPGKTVIITGGNTGIGKETARVLAERGARVILACRDMARCQAAQKELIHDTGSTNIVCKKLDLASLASVRAFAKDINKTEPRVDILINNAGVMMTPKQLTEDGFEMQIGINHFGHFLLTNLLMEKLKASAPSRIIVVSSLAHKWGRINFDDISSEKSYSKTGAYSQSKLANILHQTELVRRLKGTGVTVNSLHPGLVKTELGRHIKLLAFVLSPMVALLYKTPLEGAQTTIRLALDPSLETVTGKYYSDCAEKPAHHRGLDTNVSQKLWSLSEKLTR